MSLAEERIISSGKVTSTAPKRASILMMPPKSERFVKYESWLQICSKVYAVEKTREETCHEERKRDVVDAALFASRFAFIETQRMRQYIRDGRTM